MITIPYHAWKEEGEKLFGEKQENWKFVCPSCGHVQSIQDFRDVGIAMKEVNLVVGFSCIGIYRVMDREEQVCAPLDTQVVELGKKDKGQGCTFIGTFGFKKMPVFVQKGVAPAGGEEIPVGFCCFDFWRRG